MTMDVSVVEISIGIHIEPSTMACPSLSCFFVVYTLESVASIIEGFSRFALDCNDLYKTRVKSVVITTDNIGCHRQFFEFVKLIISQLRTFRRILNGLLGLCHRYSYES